MKFLTEDAAKLLLKDNPSKVLKGKDIDSKLEAYDGKDIGFFKKLTVFIDSIKNAREVRHDF
jgi:hypothetical protein